MIFLEKSRILCFILVCTSFHYLWNMCFTHTHTHHMYVEKHFGLPHLGPTFSLVKSHENLAVYYSIWSFIHYSWWSIAKCSSDQSSLLYHFCTLLNMVFNHSVINCRLGFEIYNCNSTWFKNIKYPFCYEVVALLR